MKSLRTVKLLMLLVVLALILQLARWQIVEHGRWETEANLRHQLLVTETPERGEILAADGAKLAYNQKVYGIYIMPAYILDVDAFAMRLSEITGISSSEIQSRLTSGKTYIALKHKVSPEQTLQILQADCDLNKKEQEPCELVELGNPELYAVRLEEESLRVYPEGSLAAHALGYVGSDSEGNESGRYGVEGYYDGELTGRYGVFMGKQDQSGRVIVDESLVTTVSQQGITLQLTIDRSVQAVAEKVAKQYVVEQNAKSGTVIVMQPSTGAILGIANYPTFDPNTYWAGEVLDCSLQRYAQYDECMLSYPDIVDDIPVFTPIPEEDDRTYTPWGAYTSNPSHIYNNLAVSDLYEPGSVVKVLTVAAGLDSEAIQPTSEVEDHPGCVVVLEKENKRICTSDKKGASNQTIENVLKKSDNIGAYYIAKAVGQTGMYDYFSGFGIGYEAKPGMEGEANNVFPLKARGTWNELDLATAAFGQGIISVTPMQLITAINTVANGGLRVQPHIVSEFIEGEDVTPVETMVLSNPISAQTAYDTSELLRKAIESQGWIKKLGDVEKYYTIAGKTGTAQVAKETTAGYYSHRVITSFIGWVPAHDPEVIILVRLEEPQEDKSAYSSAVPMWNDVTREVVTILGIPPDKLTSSAPQAPNNLLCEAAN